MWTKIKEWYKRNQFKILILINIPLLVLNLILIFAKANISVHMTQAQTQSTFLQTQNVLNNQNINLNVYGNAAYGTKMTMTARLVIKKDVVKFVKTLAYYQQLGLSLVPEGNNYLAFFPTFETVTSNYPVTFTNYSTNYKVNSVSNRTLFDLF